MDMEDCRVKIDQGQGVPRSSGEALDRWKGKSKKEMTLSPCTDSNLALSYL